MQKPYNSENTIQTCYLLIGVPGSGKTWIMNKLRSQFYCISHDDFTLAGLGDLIPKEVSMTALTSSRPLLLDCPFGEDALYEALTRQGIPVVPLVIVEAPGIIKTRYEARERMMCPQKHLTRAGNMKAKADRIGAFSGTSEEVLAQLRHVVS